MRRYNHQTLVWLLGGKGLAGIEFEKKSERQDGRHDQFSDD